MSVSKKEKFLKIELSRQMRQDLQMLREYTGLKNHMVLSFLFQYMRLNPLPFLEFINGKTYRVSGRDMKISIDDKIKQLWERGYEDPRIMSGLMENAAAMSTYGAGADSKKYAIDYWESNQKMRNDFKVYCGRCGPVGSSDEIHSAKGLRTRHLGNNKDEFHAKEMIVTIEDKKGIVIFPIPSTE